MFSFSDIRTFILDCDGSCRDITFTPVRAANLARFIFSFVDGGYDVTTATDQDGNDRAKQLRQHGLLAIVSGQEGSIHLVLACPRAWLPHLQVFIDWSEDDDRIELELTFFPNDLDPDTFDVDAFVVRVESWRRELGAENYFVRYENASWDRYDPESPGVIYTGCQLAAKSGSRF